jgi:hypothetical protein
MRMDIDRVEVIGSDAGKKHWAAASNETWMLGGRGGAEMKVVDSPFIEQTILVFELGMIKAEMRGKILPIGDLLLKQLPAGLVCWRALKIIGNPQPSRPNGRVSS